MKYQFSTTHMKLKYPYSKGFDTEAEAIVFHNNWVKKYPKGRHTIVYKGRGFEVRSDEEKFQKLRSLKSK